MATALTPCSKCNQHVRVDEAICPHCGHLRDAKEILASSVFEPPAGGLGAPLPPQEMDRMATLYGAPPMRDVNQDAPMMMPAYGGPPGIGIGGRRRPVGSMIVGAIVMMAMIAAVLYWLVLRG